MLLPMNVVLSLGAIQRFLNFRNYTSKGLFFTPDLGMTPKWENKIIPEMYWDMTSRKMRTFEKLNFKYLNAFLVQWNKIIQMNFSWAIKKQIVARQDKSTSNARRHQVWVQKRIKKEFLFWFLCTQEMVSKAFWKVWSFASSRLVSSTLWNFFSEANCQSPFWPSTVCVSSKDNLLVD